MKAVAFVDAFQQFLEERAAMRTVNEHGEWPYSAGPSALHGCHGVYTRDGYRLADVQHGYSEMLLAALNQARAVPMEPLTLKLRPLPEMLAHIVDTFVDAESGMIHREGLLAHLEAAVQMRMDDRLAQLRNQLAERGDLERRWYLADGSLRRDVMHAIGAVYIDTARTREGEIARVSYRDNVEAVVDAVFQRASAGTETTRPEAAPHGDTTGGPDEAER